jgi:hypothetical protein
VLNGIHFKFTFSTVVADNLAANWLGGFQSCFSSGYFCRRCYINYADKSLPIPLSQIKSRTMVDHDELVEEILNNPNKSPLMGVIGRSPSHDLIDFHSTVSLPGDCMHDFLEGICPMVIMSLLKQASSMRLITYGEKTFFNWDYRINFCRNSLSRFFCNGIKIDLIFTSYVFTQLSHFVREKNDNNRLRYTLLNMNQF